MGTTCIRSAKPTQNRDPSDDPWKHASEHSTGSSIYASSSSAHTSDLVDMLDIEGGSEWEASNKFITQRVATTQQKS
jgi:hypothetical protein